MIRRKNQSCCPKSLLFLYILLRSRDQDPHQTRFVYLDIYLNNVDLLHNNIHFFIQVVNFSAPLSKVRAVSPNCVRPQHKIITTPQPSPQLMPRGQISTPVRPPQHLPSPPPIPANTGKIRIRAPIVQANVQRPPVTVRPPVSQYAQVFESMFLKLIVIQLY